MGHSFGNNMRWKKYIYIYFSALFFRKCLYPIVTLHFRSYYYFFIVKENKVSQGIAKLLREIKGALKCNIFPNYLIFFP